MKIKFEDLLVEPATFDDEYLFSIFDNYHTWPREKRRAAFNRDIANQERWIESTIEFFGMGIGALEVLAGTDVSQESVARLVAWRRYQGVLKAPAVATIAKTELDAGLEKIVLFTRYKGAADVLSDQLTGYGPVAVYEGTPPEKKAHILKRFRERESCRAIICNINAANAAVNLLPAHTAIMVEPDVIRTRNAQACMRLANAYQTAPVYIRFVGLNGSIEAKLSRALKNYARRDVLGIVEANPFS